MYYTFIQQLQQLYHNRPDLKALIDPEVVVFDLGGVDTAVYTAALAAYRTKHAAGAKKPAATHPGPLPQQWNPGALGTVFPMPTMEAANYLIGYMQATVPNLRAMLLPNVPGPALTF
jgi:hypothetical protein